MWILLGAIVVLARLVSAGLDDELSNSEDLAHSYNILVIGARVSPGTVAKSLTSREWKPSQQYNDNNKKLVEDAAELTSGKWK